MGKVKSGKNTSNIMVQFHIWETNYSAISNYKLQKLKFQDVFLDDRLTTICSYSLGRLLEFPREDKTCVSKGWF